MRWTSATGSLIPILIAMLALPAGAEGLRIGSFADGVVARAAEEEIAGAIARLRRSSVSVLVRRPVLPGGRGPLVVTGVGSGVFVEHRGTWIVTNTHVLADAAALEVVAEAGTVHPARILASDERADLAVLAWEGSIPDAEPVPLDGIVPPRVEPGAWAFALGNPFLLANDGHAAATLGVVSGSIPPSDAPGLSAGAVQHDAPVNPGNSGGPLWSSAGAFLGVNETIATHSRAYGSGPHSTGASFAIAAHRVAEVARRLIDGAVPAEEGPRAAPPREVAPLTVPVTAALEAPFRAAAARALSAVVVVVPRGVGPEESGWSSGVIVTGDGLVLSDGDAGIVFALDPSGARADRRLAEVEVWVPDGAGGKRVYEGTVLARDRGVDTSLIRVRGVPPEGFPHLEPRPSAGLATGEFGFAAGCALDADRAVRPSVTAGTLAAITPDTLRGPDAPPAWVHSTASVVLGANGGPFVDLDGRLVGTISTYGDPSDPSNPHQYLGRIVPMDRVARTLRVVEEAKSLFAYLEGGGEESPPADGPAAALARRVRRAAKRARPWVVSLTVERRAPVASRAPVGEETLEPPRYAGPASGVCVSSDGLVATALYNLANPAALVEPLWEPGSGESVEAGLADIRSIRVAWPGGPTLPARLVSHDPRLGVALLQADLAGAPEGFRPEVVRAAPAESYESGRFVVAVGSPYGTGPAPPLVTTGILSKRHRDDAAAAWRGTWQIDAAVTDGNAGGAAVDLEGDFLGILAIWHPAQHGRASGVGFVVPWGRIQRALPDLVAGRVPRRALLGVRFAPGIEPRVGAIVPGTAAARAGLLAGDLLLTIDRERLSTAAEAVQVLGFRREGDRIRLEFLRAGARVERRLVLGGTGGR
jgi:S1-C subfamily serine protease